MSAKKVLVAEDSSVIQNLTKKILQFQNYEITAVKNGKEVMKELEKSTFDIILMDINMPVMDGYTATTEIRKVLQLDTPIIAMTAHALSGEREKCLGLGMNGVQRRR